jgi:hypothetical protein
MRYPLILSSLSFDGPTPIGLSYYWGQAEQKYVEKEQEYCFIISGRQHINSVQARGKV